MSDLGVNAGSEIRHSDLAPGTPGWAIFLIVASAVVGVGVVVYFVYRRFFQHQQQVPGGNPDPSGADDDGAVTAELELVASEQRSFRDAMEQLGTRASPDCSICLELFAPQEAVFVFPSCQHFFHHECVASWVATRPRTGPLVCPLCRQSVEVATAT